MPPPRARRRSRLGGHPECGARHPAARRPQPGFHRGAPTTDLAACGRQPAPAVADASYWSPSELDSISQVRSDRPHWVTSVGAFVCSGAFSVQPAKTTPIVVVLNDELPDWEQRIRGFDQPDRVRDLAVAVGDHHFVSGHPYAGARDEAEMTRQRARPNRAAGARGTVPLELSGDG